MSGKKLPKTSTGYLRKCAEKQLEFNIKKFIDVYFKDRERSDVEDAIRQLYTDITNLNDVESNFLLIEYCEKEKRNGFKCFNGLQSFWTERNLNLSRQHSQLAASNNLLQDTKVLSTVGQRNQGRRRSYKEESDDENSNRGRRKVKTSSDGSYTDNSKHPSYKLTFHELKDKTMPGDMNSSALRTFQNNFKGRCAISYVTYPSTNSYVFKQYSFAAETSKMINKFKDDVNNNSDFFTYDTSKLDKIGHHVYAILNLTLNQIKLQKEEAATQDGDEEQDIEVSNSQSTVTDDNDEEDAHKGRTKELDFIVKFVSHLFENTCFMYTPSMKCTWDSTAKIYTHSLHKRRPDCIVSVLNVNGIELGCGEVKPLNATSSGIEEDRCRVFEHLKRQLNRRIQTAKTHKEFITFGFQVAGKSLELSVMRFIDLKYEYDTLQLSLPTMSDTFEDMDSVLGYLVALFEDMANSLLISEERRLLNLYPLFKKHLKPTLSFQ